MKNITSITLIILLFASFKVNAQSWFTPYNMYSITAEGPDSTQSITWNFYYDEVGNAYISRVWTVRVIDHPFHLIGDGSEYSGQMQPDGSRTITATTLDTSYKFFLINMNDTSDWAYIQNGGSVNVKCSCKKVKKGGDENNADCELSTMNAGNPTAGNSDCVVNADCQKCKKSTSSGGGTIEGSSTLFKAKAIIYLN